LSPYCRQFRDKQKNKDDDTTPQTRSRLLNNSARIGNNNGSVFVNTANNNNNNNKNKDSSPRSNAQSRGDIFVRRTEVAPRSLHHSSAEVGDSSDGAPQKTSMSTLFRSTGQLLLHPRRIKQSLFCRKISQRNISLPFLQTLV
jgi:hypothetical protein